MMHRLGSERDIGEGGLIFATKEAGMRWLQNNPHVLEVAQENDQIIEDCIQESFDNGFFWWQQMEIIE